MKIYKISSFHALKILCSSQNALQKVVRVTVIFMVLLAASGGFSASAAPLASWNDGITKTAIITFVKSTTSKKSPDFIPKGERIAVFDNDGTLWAEQPLYFQLFYAMDRIKQMAPQHPEWKTKEPYASLLKGDTKGALAQGEKAILSIVASSHAGVTNEQFAASVSQWLATARHPKTGLAFNQMVYQPMLELLEYLRSKDFKTYIVSGGGIDFMRVFSEQTYGIPPEQVIGSSLKSEYVVKDGTPTIVKLPEMNFIDDKAGKPVGIYQYIGRRPVFAAGNSDGDFQMLEWTTTGEGARFGLLLHHTDAEREWAYDKDSHIGKLERGLAEAKQRGWVLIDMKKDWKVIYPSH